jgi:tetratricopeptide (TPR) repeat protein
VDPQSQPTFLLVDYDVNNLDSTAAQLQELGFYNTLQAEDGTEAWAMFKNFRVDFVICAKDIPEVDGISLLKLIRSHEDFLDIPFVLVAEEVTAKMVGQVGRIGVTDILVAPYDPEVLRKKIQDIITDEQSPEVVEAEKSYKQGMELMKAGQYDEALKSFETVLSVHENAEVYFNMGYIRSARGEYDDALRCFRMATRINNDYARAYKHMAEIYEKLGKKDMAGICLQRAGDIYLERKQDSEAEHIYEAVTRLRPDTTNVFNSLGIIYRRQGRHEEAVEQYLKALKVHPDDENIYYNLSRVYLELKYFKEANACLNKALEINPSFAAARELVRAVEMGLTLHG